MYKGFIIITLLY